VIETLLMNGWTEMGGGNNFVAYEHLNFPDYQIHVFLFPHECRGENEDHWFHIDLKQTSRISHGGYTQELLEKHLIFLEACRDTAMEAIMSYLSRRPNPKGT